VVGWELLVDVVVAVDDETWSFSLFAHLELASPGPDMLIRDLKMDMVVVRCE
jgi:hypothetical protein